MNYQNGYNNNNNNTNYANGCQNQMLNNQMNYNNMIPPQNQMVNNQMNFNNMQQPQNQMVNNQMNYNNMYPPQNQMINNQMNYNNMYPPQNQMINNQMIYNNMYPQNVINNNQMNYNNNLKFMNNNTASYTNNFNQNKTPFIPKSKTSRSIEKKIKENAESQEIKKAKQNIHKSVYVSGKQNNNVDNSNNTQSNPQINQSNKEKVIETKNKKEKENKKPDNDKNKDKKDKENKNNPKSQTISQKPSIKLNFIVKSRGLVNVGATCYMNSTLQCFYHIKDLSEAIINDNDIDESLEFTYCYKDLIEELTGCKKRIEFNNKQEHNEVANENVNSIKPTKFKDILSAKNPLFKGVRAGDAKDLIMFLLQEMDKEITQKKNKTTEIPIFKGENISEMKKENFKKIHNSPFGERFYGFQKLTNHCTICNKDDVGYNVLNILPLPLEKIFNSLNQKNVNDINMMSYNQIKPSDINKNITRYLKLETCFKEIQKEELLNGSNQMYCNQCQNLRDMRQKIEIYKAPKVFILILDRGKDNVFECDVNIPKKLDISEYVIDKDSPMIFDLKGIISHFGESSIEGHFTAFCKHFDYNWYQYNDAMVKSIDENNIFQGTPYILFYQEDIETE